MVLTMKDLPDWNADIKELIPFSKVKLIISDIDGTLLESGSRHEHEKFNNLVSLLKRKGIHMTFATGRAYNGVKELINIFPITKSFPLIIYNGSVCILPYDKKILYKKVIDRECLLRLIKITKKYNALLLAYEIDLPCGVDHKEITESVYAWGSFNESFSEPNGLQVKPQHKGDVYPVAAMIKNTQEPSITKKIYYELNKIHGVTFTKSSNDYIEIRPVNSDKGLAVEIISKEFNIEQDSILTIGDNDNDVEMLEYAGVSVAVNNSSLAARNAGKYASSGSNIVGLHETLELIRQARHYLSVMEGSNDNIK